MKYEITKKYFDYLILELIQFRELCSVCEYIDIYTIKDIDKLLDMLRYYRQFSR